MHLGLKLPCEEVAKARCNFFSKRQKPATHSMLKEHKKEKEFNSHDVFDNPSGTASGKTSWQ
jgi:hypothetical protein